MLAVVQLAGTWMGVAQTGTGPGSSHEGPVILVNNDWAKVPGDAGTSRAISISPRNLDFGSVPVGNSNELSFMVRNAGARLLSVGASVSPPFNLLGGSTFVLKPGQSQVITVQYAPKSPGMHMTVVHLTGADAASVTVMGSAAPRLPSAPARRRAPTQPQDQGLRLLARR
jgi:hypothetical protein